MPDALPIRGASRALSIRQPWAWAIVYGGKPVENRTWRTSHRGPLLIHAAKTFDVEGYEWIESSAQWGDLDLDRPLPSPAELVRGGLIGVVQVVTCVESVDELDGAAHAHDLDALDEWFTGPVGIVMTDPEPIRFRPCRGMPGLFRPEVAEL